MKEVFKINTMRKEADKSVLPFLKYLSENPNKNFPKIIEVGDGYYIEERINGKNLEEIVENGIIDDATAKDYMLQLCDGVELLHKCGIIHRDIKPSNIIISTFGVVKIIDFDIARTLKNEPIEKDTQILGTVGYAPPEQYGFTQTDERSDIYSMGVLYNYMLTGCIPQEKQATGNVRDIILRSTSLAPWERYINVAELRADIQKQKKKEVTLFDKVTGVIPGMRSKNIFKLAIALVFYFLVFNSQAMFVRELFSQGWEMDYLYLLSMAVFSYGYVFLFFAFLVNWCNIADRFLPKVKQRWMRRVIPAVILFATASFCAGWGLDIEGETFLTWNPVVFLVKCIIDYITKMWALVFG